MAFWMDMGARPSSAHSLDRIDNMRGYEPGNCRWATTDVQSRNTRVNRWITYDGETRTLQDWAKHLGITASLLHARLGKLGWPLSKALQANPPR